MASIFTRIIQGEIPCHKIAENDDFIAFLDITPVAIGHTLVIPKKEVDHFFDLDDQLLRDVNLFARDVAAKLQRAVPCRRIGVAIIGLEVPHAHVHLVPLNTMKDINFSAERVQMTQDELAELATKIRQA
ncbi:MAG: HIT family protein [Flavobacteriales bacterium]|nr:HIT family protein [Flavobacteriales bacterium]